MMRTFNNGLGLMAVVSEDAAQTILEMLNAMNEKAYIIGEVSSREKDESQIEWV